MDESDQLLDSGLKMKLYHYLPKFLRKWFMRKIVKNPFYIKKQGGLIVITSVGMFFSNYGWFTGFGGLSTVDVGVGRITNKLVKREGTIVTTRVMNLTLSIDHDIIVGAPAARFAMLLIDRLESGFGLSK